MIRDPGVPAAASPLDADIASGRFDRNTAAKTATLTPSPESDDRPITIDSGMPSRIVPRTIAFADPPSCGVEDLRPFPPARSIRRSPTKKVMAPRRSPKGIPATPDVANASATRS